MTFPRTRLRRLRRSPALRAMVRETTLTPANLVLPLFVTEQAEVEIPSMPGVFQLRPEGAAAAAAQAWEAGIRSVLLFGVPSHKDEVGSSAWNPEGPVPTAITAIKQSTPDIAIIADVCLCEYTDHGHCGRLEHPHGSAVVANDATLELLGRAALCYAKAGADIVAPSDMMDGRIQSIRAVLDAAGFSSVAILSYAAKYASALYGPFRDAAGSAPRSGPSDRRSYQMDPANRREALREVALDVEEGADLVMVKPALGYADVIREVADSFDVPVAAYSVSGEYAMLKAAAKEGWLDERAVLLELLTGLRRAGAVLIVTYHALQAAKALKEEFS